MCAVKEMQTDIDAEIDESLVFSEVYTRSCRWRVTAVSVYVRP